MLRQVGGVVAGLVLAMLVILAIEGAGHAVFPPGPGADLADPLQRQTFMDSVPLAAKLTVLLGWFLAALLGGWLADRIARRGLAGYVVATLIVAGGVWTMVELPHPLWMQVGGVLLPFAGAWAAERLARRRF